MQVGDVEIAGRTLLEITLTRLRTFGITEVIINVHHFADKVVDYLRAHQDFGMRMRDTPADGVVQFVCDRTPFYGDVLWTLLMLELWHQRHGEAS